MTTSDQPRVGAIAGTRVCPVLLAMRESPLDRAAIYGLLSELSTRNAASMLKHWVRAKLVVRLPGDLFAHGPNASKMLRKVNERPRRSDDDVPIELVDSDTYILWVQGGMVDTYTLDDVGEWLDIDDRHKASALIADQSKLGWVRIVKRGVYARWDRGPVVDVAAAEEVA